MKLKLLLTLLLTFAFAKAESFDSNGIRYNTTDTNTIEVVALSSGKYTGAITIPNTVTYNTVNYTVTGIGDNAFMNNEELTSIVLPSGLLYIGQSSFQSCKKLANFTFPNSLTEIGSTAFYGCEALTSITIPSGVTVMSDQVFEYCPNLVSVSLPSGITSVEREAFNACNDLTTINLPEGLTEIGESAFSSCSSLTRIELPSTLTSLGNKAFKSCEALEMVIVKNTTPLEIEATVFAENSEPSPFDEPEEILYLVVPNGSVNTYEAADAWNIFSEILTTEPVFFVEGGIRYASLGGTVVGVMPLTSGKYEGAVTIPDTVTHNSIQYSVTKIMSKAFYECYELTSVVLPTNLKTIGTSAFYECEGLTSVTLPNGITTIGTSAFSSCSELTSITIPDGVTTIGNSAFSSCSELTSVTLPSGITTIGSFTFSECFKLTSITLPAGLTSISAYSFYDCTSLSNVVVENSTPISITNVFVVAGMGGPPVDNVSNINLTVPSGSKTDYEAAAVWQDFKTITETVTLSAEKETFNNNFNIVFGQNSLSIQANNGIEVTKINLLDITGAVVTSTTQATVNVATLSKGVYILTINTNKGVFAKKVVKQ